ncbi:MAG TPA: DUF5658 family protein [Capsulimonadaceae bacterium]|nr:DUF5658 family protein [Capsulimonadaceae bacterium]
MKPSVESLVLSGICLADLASTIFLVSYRGAEEGNPLMNYFLHQGIGSFIFAKLVLFVIPLGIAEWARQHRPKFVRQTLRFAIGAYLLAYLCVFIQVNTDASSEFNLRSGHQVVSASMLPGDRR